MTYRLTTSLLLSTLAATAFAGCQPKGDLGEYTGTSEIETGATTGAPASTGASDDTGATGDTGDTGNTGDTGETGTPACGPPELDLQADFKITLDPPLPEEGGVVAADCTVDTVEGGGTFLLIELGCGDRKATIDFGASNPYSLVFKQGDTLAFAYHLNDYGVGTEQWFTLRTTGPDSDVLLGGLNAFSLQPGDDDDTFFQPVVMKTVSGVCPLPSGCDDPFERLLLEVSYGGETRQIVSGAIGQIGGMRIDLAVAEGFHDDDCNLADVPGEIFRALLIPVPED